MGTENKANVRQRKKSEKSNDVEQELVKKDPASNGDDNSKQKKQ